MKKWWLLHTLLLLYSLNGVLGEPEQFLPVSMGPALESTSYIYMTISHESLNRKKIAALGLIIGGILVYSFLD